ncbi:syntaxin-binding protein 5-like [Lampetra planeri]
MKRFTDNFRKVLDGLTTPGAPQSPSKPESEIAESLASEHFQVSKTVRHGFPHQPTALAFDPVQKILAVGTHGGALRVFGRPGVDCFCQHENGVEVTQLMFMVNEGALISRCSDDSLHLWNLRQKQPAVLHSLKFHKESIGCAHLPFQSKWLYIGTKKGNIHVVNVECFQLSGYVIMWNRAIELSTKAHPGSIVHISDNPVDEGKLLIGYERGTVVLWDLKSKKADFRYYYEEEIHSVSWHHEGKQFVCSHSDGSLTTWNVRSPARPTGLIVPHKKPFKEGRKVEVCGPILKVEHKTCRTAEPFTIFSGGLVEGKAKRSSLSVMHGRNITVLEMDSNIVDFLTLCETPYPSDFQDPYAVVVLLEKDMVVVDLTQSGYPIFENPYAMDIHDSPVTFCEYFADCSVEIIPALYSVGARQKKQGFSKQEWPISGGSWDIGNQSYPEVIITGHADGSLKFWDASAITLQLLYKLRTAKIFERPRRRRQRRRAVPEDPFAVQLLAWCPESRMLCVAGASSHVVFYRFSRQEAVGEIAVLEVRMQPEPEGAETPDPEPPPAPSGPSPGLPASSSQLPYPRGHPSSASTGSGDGAVPSLRVKSEAVRQWPGYQAELVVQLVWADGETSQLPTSLEVSSAYGLVALGTCSGLVVVDVLQRSILLSLSCLDLYGSSDPYQRQPKSPRKSKQLAAGLADITEGIGAPDTERSRSPSSVKRHRKLSLPSDLKTSLETRDNSLGQSRSSSVCSIDKESRESVTALRFSESFARKGDGSTCPCLWVGTSLGTVLSVGLSLPPSSEQRLSQPVIISPSGTVTLLKGPVLRVDFLDCGGALARRPHEPWRDTNSNSDERDERGERARRRRPQSVTPSASAQELGAATQYVVACSEKQAKVVALPSHSCVYKHNITETSFVLRADAVAIGASACLASFCANGHIIIFSLPSLRPLLDVNFLPLADLRAARTFCFSNSGQALYLCSPTEIQRITYSQEMCESLQDMLGELFIPVQTPEAPNKGFFKGLFGGNSPSLDREELFGETGSGRASRSLAQHIPGHGSGSEGVKAAAGGVAAEMSRARVALDERGQRLGDLEDRTAAMLSGAENFSKHAHEMMLKTKDKKWYQL